VIPGGASQSFAATVRRIEVDGKTRRIAVTEADLAADQIIAEASPRWAGITVRFRRARPEQATLPLQKVIFLIDHAGRHQGIRRAAKNSPFKSGRSITRTPLLGIISAPALGPDLARRSSVAVRKRLTLARATADSSRFAPASAARGQSWTVAVSPLRMAMQDRQPSFAAGGRGVTVRTRLAVKFGRVRRKAGSISIRWLSPTSEGTWRRAIGRCGRRRQDHGYFKRRVPLVFGTARKELHYVPESHRLGGSERGGVSFVGSLLLAARKTRDAFRRRARSFPGKRRHHTLAGDQSEGSRSSEATKLTPPRSDRPGHEFRNDEVLPRRAENQRRAV